MHRCKLILLLIFIGAAGVASAQTNRYIVFFKDKNSSPFNINAPENFLSARAISRRVKQDIAVTVTDIPVNPSYIQQVKAAGSNVYFPSRWLNCVLIQTTQSIADAVGALAFVSKVERVALGSRLPLRTRASKGGKKINGAEATKKQLAMVGIDEMQADEMLGEGIHIAVMDSGFPGVDDTEPFYHLVQDNKILSAFDFVHNTRDVYRYDDHGTEVLSVIAANSDSYTGGAYNASFHLYVTEDVPTEYPVEEYNFLFAAERADSAGVDIIHTSLGYNEFDSPFTSYNKVTDLNGEKAVISKAAKFALDRGIVVVCSAGNEGNIAWQLVTPPADVEGVLAIGSVTTAGTRSVFSSKGPTSDGRIKPDVVALGSGVAVITQTGSNGLTNGTSLSAPIITSLVAGLLQRFPELDPDDITDAIKTTASQAANPDNSLGYGIPSYTAVKAKLERFKYEDEISISPNPTDTGTFNIYFKNIGVRANVMIYDMAGKELSTHQLDVTNSTNPIIIDVAELPPGTYLVKVKTSDNFKTFRIVKL